MIQASSEFLSPRAHCFCEGTLLVPRDPEEKKVSLEEKISSVKEMQPG